MVVVQVTANKNGVQPEFNSSFGDLCAMSKNRVPQSALLLLSWLKLKPQGLSRIPYVER